MIPLMLLAMGLFFVVSRQNTAAAVALFRTPGQVVSIVKGKTYAVTIAFSGVTVAQLSKMTTEFYTNPNLELQSVSLKTESAGKLLATAVYNARSSAKLTIGSTVAVGPIEGTIQSIASK